MNFKLDDEQRSLIEASRTLATREWGGEPIQARTDPLPRATLRLLASHGLAGINLPDDVGGQGQTLLNAVLVLEAIAQVNVTAGDCIQALNFGAIQQIAAYGSPELRSRFLQPSLEGGKLVTVAMTEPDAGSALTDLRTRADRSGAVIVLNGQKLFTTHADSADFFVVWTRFGPKTRDVGAVIVERGAPGFTIDSAHRFVSGESYGVLHFDDCAVPEGNVLLDHDGFRAMFSVFNVERLGNAARSLALGKTALDLAVHHVRDRQQFGRPLADFQGLQWRLAEMALQLEGAQLLLYRAAANAENGTPSPWEACLAKLACNRAGFEVAQQALQMFGGYGFDGQSAISYLFLRTRGWMIAGGTAEQMLNRIAETVIGKRISQWPLPPN